MQYFQDMQINELMASGLVGGVLAAISCGLVGPYVVTRRIVFLSGAIAHFSVAGVGAAIFCQEKFGWIWFDAFHGAAISAVAGALLIGIVNARVKERMDTLIGAMWAVGMAVGLVLLKYAGGYQSDPMIYLFGNLSYIDWHIVWYILAFDIIVVACVAIFHKRIVAICLDEEFARLQHVNPLRMNLLLLVLVALTVVMLMQFVGLILAIALLTLPAAAAGHHFGRLGTVMLVSVLICALLTTLPRIAFYDTRINPESGIVLVAAGVYLISLLLLRGRQLITARR